VGNTTWYAFKGYNNNKAVNVSQFDIAELTALGFHGYLTQAQAEAKPNSVPGFPNPLAVVAIPVVNAAINDANNARDVASAPGNAANAAASAAAGAVPDVAGSLINFIKQGTIWERVVEVAIGGILLYIGLKAMTGVNIPSGPSTVTKVAKKAVGK
jgi:hypothetical protein